MHFEWEYARLSVWHYVSKTMPDRGMVSKDLDAIPAAESGIFNDVIITSSVLSNT